MNGYLQTSIPGILPRACDPSYDLIRKRKVCNGIWPSAVRQGRIAGWNMAGLAIRDDGDVPMSTRCTCSGAPSAPGVLNGDETSFGKLSGGELPKLVFARSQLVGALFWGSCTECGAPLLAPSLTGEILMDGCPSFGPGRAEMLAPCPMKAPLPGRLPFSGSVHSCIGLLVSAQRKSCGEV